MAANRVIRVLDSALNAMILLLCALILLVSLFSLYDNFSQYHAADDPELRAYKPAEGDRLDDEKRITENQVAWLTVERTAIDYPVMQGKDNFEYLNLDPYGEFSLSGSIFLDCRNDPGLRDEYSIIYGHHMEHGVMFGTLDDFADKEFFDAHRTGRIACRNAVYDLNLFAVTYGDGNNRTLFDPEGRQASEVLAYVADHALWYAEPTEGSRIVALSTCSGDDLETRLLVFGTIKEL